MSAETDFARRVAERDVVVGVVGLGYVGLPLALGFAEAGFRAIGVDVDVERVAALADGHSHIEDVDDAVVRDARRRRAVPPDGERARPG